MRGWAWACVAVTYRGCLVTERAEHHEDGYVASDDAGSFCGSERDSLIAHLGSSRTMVPTPQYSSPLQRSARAAHLASLGSASSLRRVTEPSLQSVSLSANAAPAPVPTGGP